MPLPYRAARVGKRALVVRAVPHLANTPNGSTIPIRSWAWRAARARRTSSPPIASSPRNCTPTATRTIPRRPSALARSPRAYDLLSDKDKRAQFDRGEIDVDGNPAMPFGGRRFGGGGFDAAAVRRGQRGLRPAASRASAAEGVDLGDMFEGLFGGRRRRPAVGAGRAAASAAAAAPRRRRAAPTSQYRLQVPFADAARASSPADHAGRRQDDRPQAARRGRGRHPDAAHGQGRARPGRRGRRAGDDRRSSRTRSSAATATISGSTCRSRSTRR